MLKRQYAGSYVVWLLKSARKDAADVLEWQPHVSPLERLGCRAPNLASSRDGHLQVRIRVRLKCGSQYP